MKSVTLGYPSPLPSCQWRQGGGLHMGHWVTFLFHLLFLFLRSSSWRVTGMGRAAGCSVWFLVHRWRWESRRALPSEPIARSLAVKVWPPVWDGHFGIPSYLGPSWKEKSGSHWPGCKSQATSYQVWELGWETQLIQIRVVI
jgi:hypothetical protein